MKQRQLPPDTIWTENHNVFKAMNLEDVLHNYNMYKRYVDHPAFAEERPALQLGLDLCKQEIELRNAKLNLT